MNKGSERLRTIPGVSDAAVQLSQVPKENNDLNRNHRMLSSFPPLLAKAFHVYSHATIGQDGATNRICALKLTTTDPIQQDTEPVPTIQESVTHDLVIIGLHETTRPDGSVQTYRGLRLANSGTSQQKHTPNTSSVLHLRNDVSATYREQKYCGLKLIDGTIKISSSTHLIANVSQGNRQKHPSRKHGPSEGTSTSKCRTASHRKPRKNVCASHGQRKRHQGRTTKGTLAAEASTSMQGDPNTETSLGQTIGVGRPDGHRVKRVQSAGKKVKTPRRAAFVSRGAPVTYNNIGGPISVCQNCDAKMWDAEKSRKKNKTDRTTFSLCCQDGKVLLPKLMDPPEPLRQLLDYRETGNAGFKENIRAYNSVFCFTSFGAKIDNSVNEGRGLYTFRISGQNYHRMGSLLPNQGDQPKFAQLYFYDTQNEVRNRISAVAGNRSADCRIDASIVTSLMNMLNEHSFVAKAFRMARDWCDQHTDTDCELHLIGEVHHSRQYNAPTVPEIVVLITDDFGETDEPRDIIIKKRNGPLKRISELHHLYMALQYPLLFPYGESGFNEKIPYHNNTGKRKTKRGCLTMREYYCYRLHHRESESTTLLRGGRLFQQYLVDAYTAIEEQRLRWIRNHQNDLRADLYNNICDAVTRGDTRADAIGQRIVLPSSFTGSPRYMVQNYQDAMALCRAFGNPDLFITFTANPKWPEVSEMVSLIGGQKPHDRAETVSRVFKMKLNSLMKDIRKKDIFGASHAGVYTVEFQKRGLPHAHILIWVELQSKCKTPAQIDDLISAEIPSEVDDPQGYKAVTDYMMHGPCGKDSKNAPCTVDGRCTKHFPKPFYEETTIDEDGYPVYRRRNNKVSVLKNKVRLNNGFVVPYNRYLLIKYDAHINVEWCNRSRAIKYLFKYLNKGPDRATMVVHENVTIDGKTNTEKIFHVDEVQNYLDCRYLSPCEAVWRMFAFDIHYAYPPVMKLTFHLPNQNVITLRDTENLSALIHREGIKNTMFTEWFELNKHDGPARKLTYAQIPTEYTWNATFKIWTKREQGKSIGRIVYCNPAAGPQYYLRMLLNIVKGPTSYEDIRTIDGRTYETFKEACYAAGLLNDDKEWTAAIQEAKLWATGGQLRELFVTILLFCEVTSPLKLWDENWADLAEDMLYKKRKQFRFPDMQLSDKQKKSYCLVDIEDLLHKNGKSLDDYPDLPKPDPTLLTHLDNRLIREELAYKKETEAAEHERLFHLLNPEQHAIYAAVIESVQQKKVGFYFVYGPGGSGKTFLYKTIISRLRSEGMIVLAVASSGIASLLLPAGRTAHSRFLIPLELMDNSTCNVKQNSHLAGLLQETCLVIWDEAPMTQKHAFEALDRTLKDILACKDPANRERVFGGMTMLLGGDFRQILPVIPKGKRSEVVRSCINKSFLWQHVHVYSLSRSMRVTEQNSTGDIDVNKREFNKWILAIGDGKVTATAKEGEDEPSWIEIPEKFVVQHSAAPIDRIVNETFPDFENQQYNEHYLRERAILTPKNSDADEINEFMFNKLEGTPKTYKSADEICTASTDTLEQQDLYPVEFLNSLDFPGMPPHALTLKQGLPVMLLRNVSPAQGLCNGTRLIITELGKFVIQARIITGSRIGETALIPRICLMSTKSKWPFIMKRRQFPLRACYAMTVNKSQGQSLNFVGVYLPSPVFSHGQLYVALSRVTQPEGLKVLMLRNGGQGTNYRTRNIVYKEVFNNIWPSG